MVLTLGCIACHVGPRSVRTSGPICARADCMMPIDSILDLLRCAACKRSFHRRCVYRASTAVGVLGHEIPFCFECRTVADLESEVQLAAMDAGELALARSTAGADASRVRTLEHTLRSWLGLSWDRVFPPSGTVQRDILYRFLLLRKTHGATCQMVLSELALWDKYLLELDFGRLPAEYLALKVEELFPSKGMAPAVPKPALAAHTVEVLLTELHKHWSITTDKIARTLVLRDVWLLCFGFYHLLRRSELVAV